MDQNVYGLERNLQNLPTFALREQSAIQGLLHIDPVYLPEPDSEMIGILFNSFIEQLTLSPDISDPDTISYKIKNDYYNNFFVHTILQTLKLSKELLCDSIATNISKTALYTEEQGFLGLFFSNSIQYNQTAATPDTRQIKCPFICERTVKTQKFNMVKYKESLCADIDTSSSKVRSKDTLLRNNAKNMLSHTTADNKPSYNNLVIGWYKDGKYCFPLAKSDLVFAIVSKFRPFDTALYNFFTQLNRKEHENSRKLTKTLYKKHIALIPDIFSDISLKQSNTEKTDALLYNYEMERLFHFTYLQELLRIRRIVEPYIPIANKVEFDNMLIRSASLPNAFSRIDILHDALETHLHISCRQGRKRIMDNMQINSHILETMEKYIESLSRIYYPVAEKSFFYSMTNNINMVHGQLQMSIWNNPWYNFEYIIKYLLAAIDKNAPLFSEDQSACQRNFISPPLPVERLTTDDIDFLTGFYEKLFSYESYKYHNDYMLCKDYFGIPQYGSEIPDDTIKLVCEIREKIIRHSLTHHPTP